MKRLLFNSVLILLLVPLLSSYSFVITEHNYSMNVSSTIQAPDFRGLWKDDLGTYQIIWIDEFGKYQFLYMDHKLDVTKTLMVELIGEKLLIETVFLETDWKVTYILSLVNEDTINLEGKNQNGSFYQTLKRIN